VKICLVLKSHISVGLLEEAVKTVLEEEELVKNIEAGASTPRKKLERCSRY
jgi:hypothetical protein